MRPWSGPVSHAPCEANPAPPHTASCHSMAATSHQHHGPITAPHLDLAIRQVAQLSQSWDVGLTTQASIASGQFDLQDLSTCHVALRDTKPTQSMRMSARPPHRETFIRLPSGLRVSWAPGAECLPRGWTRGSRQMQPAGGLLGVSFPVSYICILRPHQQPGYAPAREAENARHDNPSSSGAEAPNLVQREMWNKSISMRLVADQSGTGVLAPRGDARIFQSRCSPSEMASVSAPRVQAATSSVSGSPPSRQSMAAGPG